jgi:ElaB/YqjD/DUF883 family membrane-anchored ribosome-binding protein
MTQQAISTENQTLLQDVRQVLSNTEDLLHTASDEGGEKAKELKKRIADNIKQAKARLVDVEQAVVGKAKVAAKATDQYVHENPWKAIGIAAGVGVLLGLLISRR